MDIQLDIENADSLAAYLREVGRLGADEQFEMRTLSGGVSNRTVWLRLPNQPPCVLKQSLEKLRVEADWYCSPERIHREAAGIRMLTQLTPPAVFPG